VYELVNEAKLGNKEAFTKIITEMENELYKIARLRLKNEDDIDDAIQETMIKAFKSIKKLKKEEYFKTWIIKILINNCNNIYRKKKKKEILIEDYSMELKSEINKLEHVENELDFYSIIKVLDYEEKIILVLYYMENFTTKEISKIIKLNSNTVKSKLLRAKNKLKEVYGGEREIWMN
jgi:RNA polymerase sigma factor (sigma-70 family)